MQSTTSAPCASANCCRDLPVQKSSQASGSSGSSRRPLSSRASCGPADSMRAHYLGQCSAKRMVPRVGELHSWKLLRRRTRGALRDRRSGQGSRRAPCTLGVRQHRRGTSTHSGDHLVETSLWKHEAQMSASSMATMPAPEHCSTICTVSCTNSSNLRSVPRSLSGSWIGRAHPREAGGRDLAGVVVERDVGLAADVGAVACEHWARPYPKPSRSNRRWMLWVTAASPIPVVTRRFSNSAGSISPSSPPSQQNLATRSSPLSGRAGGDQLAAAAAPKSRTSCTTPGPSHGWSGVDDAPDWHVVVSRIVISPRS